MISVELLEARLAAVEVGRVLVQGNHSSATGTGQRMARWGFARRGGALGLELSPASIRWPTEPPNVIRAGLQVLASTMAVTLGWL